MTLVPEGRVDWTETVREADKTLAGNITTFELLPDGGRTRLKVTVQVTSFVGEGMIVNTTAGYSGPLANRARFFERSSAS